jgi:hypothetical protein
MEFAFGRADSNAADGFCGGHDHSIPGGT